MRGNIPPKTIIRSCWHTHTNTHSGRNASFILMRFQPAIIKSASERSRAELPDYLISFLFYLSPSFSLTVSLSFFTSPPPPHQHTFPCSPSSDKPSHLEKRHCPPPPVSSFALLCGMRRKPINVPSVCINHISTDRSDSRLNCLCV